MKTKLNIDQLHAPHPSPPAGPASRGARRSKPLALLAWAGALFAGAISDVTAANILDNDPEHGFKPTITISNHTSESVVIDRSGPSPVFGTKANPEKISATVYANLAGFRFTEIAEDMPVSLRVGGFAFAATLGEDASRPKNRDGSLRPFDPKKATAVYLLRAELPPLKPGGAPRLRTVGSVKLAWNLYRLAARLVLSDVAAAEADGILVPDEASFPEGSATLAFSCEKIPVEITFGSAAGSRIAYGRGRLTTSVRKLGTARERNLTNVSLHSMAMVGEADIVAPKLAARIPTIDEAPFGVISFNGTVTDLAARPLSGEIDPVTIHVLVDGVPVNGGTDESADFGLHITDGDAKGQRLFSVADLPLAATEPGTVSVSIYATDASGNSSPVLHSRVSVRGAGQ